MNNEIANTADSLVDNIDNEIANIANNLTDEIVNDIAFFND